MQLGNKEMIRHGTVKMDQQNGTKNEMFLTIVLFFTVENFSYFSIFGVALSIIEKHY